MGTGYRTTTDGNELRATTGDLLARLAEVLNQQLLPRPVHLDVYTALRGASIHLASVADIQPWAGWLGEDTVTQISEPAHSKAAGFHYRMHSAEAVWHGQHIRVYAFERLPEPGPRRADYVVTVAGSEAMA